MVEAEVVITVFDPSLNEGEITTSLPPWVAPISQTDTG